MPSRLPGRAALGAVLFVSTLAVFLPALGNGFIEVDDGTYVFHNPDVLRGLSAASVRWALSTRDFPTWHPLTLLSHLLDVSLFGASPWGHHLTSVVLHAITAVLVFLGLDEATGARRRSALVAALFAVHPLRVESVAWVAERKDVLCGMFCALAVWLYVRYRRSPSWPRAMAVTAAFVAALGAKPMAVTLPCVFLLLDIWPLGMGEGWRARLRAKLPWLGLGAVLSIVTVVFQRRAGAVQTLENLSLVERLQTVPLAYVKALALSAWPQALSFQYLRRPPAPLDVLLATALLLALAAAAWRLRHTRPSLGVGLAWFAGMMLPTVGLIQVGAQLIADRYTYFPHVGLLAGVVFALPADLPERSRWRAWLTAAVVLAALAARTERRLQDWRDSGTLYDAALAVDPENDWVLVARGILRLHGHADAGARADLERALHLRPNNSFARGILALVELDEGQAAAALQDARSAVRSAPSDAALRTILGRALLASGDPVQAVAEFRQSLALEPASPEARRGLVTALGTSGQHALALEEARAARARWPDDPDLAFDEAVALAQLGRLREAEEKLVELRQSAPSYAAAATMLQRVREDLHAAPRP